MISISIVSHQQFQMVKTLLDDLSQICSNMKFEVILTINVPETMIESQLDYSFPIKVIHNQYPKGFGSNHNSAFEKAQGNYFCVLNPDVRLRNNPFEILLQELNKNSGAIIAPIVLNPDLTTEDSVRHFPTIQSLVKKLFKQYDGIYVFSENSSTQAVDWVGGMFMLFKSCDFSAVGRFDEKFFLYYEDVDICARLWKSRKKVLVCPKVSIIHDAQRQSRKNLRYMKWHLNSMARYFWKHFGRIPKISQG